MRDPLILLTIHLAAVVGRKLQLLSVFLPTSLMLQANLRSDHAVSHASVPEFCLLHPEKPLLNLSFCVHDDVNHELRLLLS